ncbi:hypothetical protein GJ688_12515 [Heliobacillus mobilis]|uniref:Uncharacterized protein n=1 Tax=Heliobacterium mobile TaxID=28064 RepID=A0A6I3SM36_HELMO|nr:hypothetical protein [Heliobacterium mobile]
MNLREKFQRPRRLRVIRDYSTSEIKQSGQRPAVFHFIGCVLSTQHRFLAVKPY